MLIPTLPQIYRDELLEEMISHPLVDAVRYNTGMAIDVSADEILYEVTKLTGKYDDKPVAIDIKGRQLRITECSQAPYGVIRLNHPIKVGLPAKVYFRGDHVPRLIKKIIDGDVICVDPPPKAMVGNGQSVNIIAPDLRILDDYFLARDIEFIDAASRFGISLFMFSFVEFKEDIDLFRAALSKIGQAKIMLKIESQNGLDLVRGMDTIPIDIGLMAARDDLAQQIGVIEATKAARLIIEKDPYAICASRLLMGLESKKDEIETSGDVTLADVSDLELMRSMGYRKFMLSDGISHRHFKKAMEFWTEYIKE